MTLSIDEASLRLANKMTGQAVIQGRMGVEAGRQLRDALIRRSRAAQRDPVKFMEFVMRDFSPPQDQIPEHIRELMEGVELNKGGTGNRIFKLAPHQEVLTEFMHDHDRSVVIMPVGFTKTFVLIGLTMFEMGLNPNIRGMVVSATQGQASKLISTIRSYIDTSLELNMVFPGLRRSPYSGAKWRDNAITIERSHGMKDASLAAYGVQSEQVNGSRIGWMVVDDVLDRQNVATKTQRDTVYDLLDNTFLGRMDTTSGSKVLVTNQAWHPDDTLHRMEKHGWPTLRMNVLGDIFVRQDVRNLPSERNGQRDRSWSSDNLRPAYPGKHITRDGIEHMRLTKHDPDPHNEKVLWPQRAPKRFIDEYLRAIYLPLTFNRLYMAEASDNQSRMCKQEYIDNALERGRQRGYEKFESRYEGTGAFTGVDLAFRTEDKNDFTAFVTFCVEGDGTRKLLDVEYCKISTAEIVDKIFDKQRRFNSVVVVENNGAQNTVIEWALKKDLSLNIRPHTTTSMKAHPEYGVQSFFLELANKAWVFPSGRGGVHPKMLVQLMDACLNYEPSNHTDDGLMAVYFGRELAREWFGVDGPGTGGGAGNIGSVIMSR